MYLNSDKGPPFGKNKSMALYGWPWCANVSLSPHPFIHLFVNTHVLVPFVHFTLRNHLWDVNTPCCDHFWLSQHVHITALVFSQKNIQQHPNLPLLIYTYGMGKKCESCSSYYNKQPAFLLTWHIHFCYEFSSLWSRYFPNKHEGALYSQSDLHIEWPPHVWAKYTACKIKSWNAFAEPSSKSKMKAQNEMGRKSGIRKRKELERIRNM